MRSHHLRAAAGNAGGGSVITTNLRRHYDFGDTNCYDTQLSTTTINDLSGNYVSPGNLSGTFNTAPTYSTNNGGHVVLSTGQGSIITTNTIRQALTSVAGTGNFTIEFWVNLYLPQTTTTSGLFDGQPSHIVFSPQFIFYYRIMKFIFTGTGFEGMGFSGSSNSWEWNVTTGVTTPSGGQYNYSQTPVFETNAYSGTGYQGWEHIVLTRTSTGTNGMKLYRNNVLKYTGTNSINYNFTGATSGSQTYGVDYAKMAIIREYLYGFTAADVQQNYNAEKSRFGL